MRAYAAQGRQASALKQFETCRKILTRELGVEPEPETVALYRNIRKQRALAVEGETTTAAMMAAIDRHRKRVPQSQRYYEKKSAPKERDTTKPSAPSADTSAASSSRCSARSGPTGSIPDQNPKPFSNSLFRIPAGWST